MTCFYSRHFSVNHLHDSGDYLLSVAALPSPCPKQGSNQYFQYIVMGNFNFSLSADVTATMASRLVTVAVLLSDDADIMFNVDVHKVCPSTYPSTRFKGWPSRLSSADKRRKDAMPGESVDRMSVCQSVRYDVANRKSAPIDRSARDDVRR